MSKAATDRKRTERTHRIGRRAKRGLRAGIASYEVLMLLPIAAVVMLVALHVADVLSFRQDVSAHGRSAAMSASAGLLAPDPRALRREDAISVSGADPLLGGFGDIREEQNSRFWDDMQSAGSAYGALPQEPAGEDQNNPVEAAVVEAEGAFTQAEGSAPFLRTFSDQTVEERYVAPSLQRLWDHGDELYRTTYDTTVLADLRRLGSASLFPRVYPASRDGQPETGQEDLTEGDGASQEQLAQIEADANAVEQAEAERDQVFAETADIADTPEGIAAREAADQRVADAQTQLDGSLAGLQGSEGVSTTFEATDFGGGSGDGALTAQGASGGGGTFSAQSFTGTGGGSQISSFGGGGGASGGFQQFSAFNTPAAHSFGSVGGGAAGLDGGTVVIGPVSDGGATVTSFAFTPSAAGAPSTAGGPVVLGGGSGEGVILAGGSGDTLLLGGVNADPLVAAVGGSLKDDPDARPWDDLSEEELGGLANCLEASQIEELITAAMPEETPAGVIHQAVMDVMDEALIDTVQLTIGLGGLAPVVGEAADGLNAVISACRGDYVGAALDGVSVVPVVGWVSSAINMGRRSVRAGGTFYDGVMSVFRRTEPDGVAAAGSTVRRTKLCSFHGDTLVMSQRGMVPIKQLSPLRDRVWARDELTGVSNWEMVLDRYSNAYPATVRLTVTDQAGKVEQTILSNRVHPFFVQRRGSDIPTERAVALESSVRSLSPPPSSEGYVYRGPILGGAWVDAQHLVSGDLLLNPDGGWSIVSTVDVRNEPLRAYNLTVENKHTYFVSGNPEADPVWVHNDCVHLNFASRNAAFRGVKREAGLPQSAQPTRIYREPLRGDNGIVRHSDGRPVMTRNYVYDHPEHGQIVIQEHSLGHPQFTGQPAARPHFNVHRISGEANGVVQTQRIPGLSGHYTF